MTKARDLANLLADGSISATELSADLGQLSNRNMLQNGNFIVSQDYWDSANALTNDRFVVDRWRTPKNTDVSATWQRVWDDVPEEHDHAMKFTVTSGVTTQATHYSLFWQAIEGHNTHRLSWGRTSAKRATLSFWVKSSLTGTFGVFTANNSQNRVYAGSYTINSANTWEWKTVSVSATTSGGFSRSSSVGIYVGFSLGCGTTYARADGQWHDAQTLGVTGQVNVTETTGATWVVAGVQFEVGDATPYEHLGYAETLQICRRYYIKSPPSSQEAVTIDGSWDTSMGLMTASKHNNYYDFHGFFPVEMRATPTMTLFSQSGVGSLRIEIPGVTNMETSKTPDTIRSSMVGVLIRYTVNETSRSEWQSGSGNAFGRIGYIADARL